MRVYNESRDNITPLNEIVDNPDLYPSLISLWNWLLWATAKFKRHNPVRGVNLEILWCDDKEKRVHCVGIGRMMSMTVSGKRN